MALDKEGLAGKTPDKRQGPHEDRKQPCGLPNPSLPTRLASHVLSDLLMVSPEPCSVPPGETQDRTPRQVTGSSDSVNRAEHWLKEGEPRPSQLWHSWL